MSEAALPASRRSRVSPWGQPEVVANPSAGGPTAVPRPSEMPAGNRTVRPRRAAGRNGTMLQGAADVAAHPLIAPLLHLREPPHLGAAVLEIIALG